MELSVEFQNATLEIVMMESASWPGWQMLRCLYVNSELSQLHARVILFQVVSIVKIKILMACWHVPRYSRPVGAQISHPVAA